MLKKRKNGSRALERINQPNKNSNYNNVSYNNDNIIITILWYIKNLGILVSDIFSHGQAY